MVNREVAWRNFFLGLAIILVLFVIVVRGVLGARENQARQSVREFGGLKVSLNINKLEFAPGEKVRVCFAIKNVSRKKLRLDFPDNNEFDILVQRDINLLLLNLPLNVWERSIFRLSSPRLHHCWLNPGEQRVYSSIWDQTNFQGQMVAPGRYLITAILRMTNARVVLSVKETTLNR